MRSDDCNGMFPETPKTTVRVPFSSNAARKLPGPESFKLVTAITRPPRPPLAFAPKPSAPGNAGTLAETGIATTPNSTAVKPNVRRIRCGYA